MDTFGLSTKMSPICIEYFWFVLLGGQNVQFHCNTVEPPIEDPPRKGQPPYKGYSSHSSSTFLTSKKRTTSQQKTKQLIPRCPLFGGSTAMKTPIREVA